VRAWARGEVVRVPFALILLAIAVGPLVPQASHWWDDNLHKL
jgi:hypothetical protein